MVSLPEITVEALVQKAGVAQSPLKRVEPLPMHNVPVGKAFKSFTHPKAIEIWDIHALGPIKGGKSLLMTTTYEIENTTLPYGALHKIRSDITFLSCDIESDNLTVEDKHITDVWNYELHDSVVVKAFALSAHDEYVIVVSSYLKQDVLHANSNFGDHSKFQEPKVVQKTIKQGVTEIRALCKNSGQCLSATRSVCAGAVAEIWACQTPSNIIVILACDGTITLLQVDVVKQLHGEQQTCGVDFIKLQKSSVTPLLNEPPKQENASDEMRCCTTISVDILPFVTNTTKSLSDEKQSYTIIVWMCDGKTYICRPDIRGWIRIDYIFYADFLNTGSINVAHPGDNILSPYQFDGNPTETAEEERQITARTDTLKRIQQQSLDIHRMNCPNFCLEMGWDMTSKYLKDAFEWLPASETQSTHQAFASHTNEEIEMLSFLRYQVACAALLQSKAEFLQWFERCVELEVKMKEWKSLLRTAQRLLSLMTNISEGVIENSKPVTTQVPFASTDTRVIDNILEQSVSKLQFLEGCHVNSKMPFWSTATCLQQISYDTPRIIATLFIESVWPQHGNATLTHLTDRQQSEDKEQMDILYPFLVDKVSAMTEKLSFDTRITTPTVHDRNAEEILNSLF